MPPINAQGPSPRPLDIGLQPGNTAMKAAELARSTLVFTRGTEPLQQALRVRSGSTTLDKVVTDVGKQQLGKMFERNVKAKVIIDRLDLGHPDAAKPETVLKTLGHQTGAMPTRLTIELEAYGNHYSPRNNSVHVSDPSRLPYAAHELQHALDHTSGAMDLNQPTHRLASELNAFSTQEATSKDLHHEPDFRGGALKQARTYEGKDPATYPGTIESSQDAVRTWRAAQHQAADNKRIAESEARRAETLARGSDAAPMER